jgi:dihydroxy-acid dehydratase
MDRRELNLQVDEDELARRQQEWKAPQRLLRGVLAKYARLVGSAADGAVCG